MMTMRLILWLASAVLLSGCVNSRQADAQAENNSQASTMTTSAIALQERLVAQCAEDIRKGFSEDTTVLRCYSRKLEQLVDLAMKELSKAKTEMKE